MKLCRNCGHENHEDPEVEHNTVGACECACHWWNRELAQLADLAAGKPVTQTNVTTSRKEK